MCLPRFLFALALGTAGGLWLAAAPGASRALASPPSAWSSSLPADDSTGARLRVQRHDDGLHVQGLFTADRASPDTLRYTLTLHRTGPTGTSRSAQSGSFTPAPATTDTLSTISLNVQLHARITIRLTVRRGPAVIGDAHWQRAECTGRHHPNKNFPNKKRDADEALLSKM